MKRQREALRSWEETWSAAFEARGHRVVIEVEPAVEPPPSAPWHWWITFRAGDAELDAIAAPQPEALAFEDERGRFEEVVPLGAVADHVLRRLADDVG